MNKKVLVLDFDGVICNSINECMIVADNAYRCLTSGCSGRFFNVDASPSLCRFFRKNRCFVRPAGEYFVLMKHYYEKGATILSRQEFCNLKEKFSSECAVFSGIFFHVRESFRLNYADKWYSCNNLYPGVSAGLASLNNKYQVYICTTKDALSVKLILSHAGIEMKEQNIFSKDVVDCKRDAVIQIALRNNASYNDIWFIDDNIEYLDNLSSLGIYLCLALWGYNLPGSAGIASKKNMRIFRNFEHMTSHLMEV